MKLLASAALLLAGLSFSLPSMARDEVLSIDYFQPLSTNIPGTPSSVDLNQLAQNNGLSLKNKTIVSASMNAGGYGTLLLQAGGRTVAQASIDPNVGYGTLNLKPGTPVGSAKLVLQNGNMFIETINLTVRSEPVVILPPPGNPQKLHLAYHNGIRSGQSVSFQIPAGQVKRIVAKWTDYTEGAKVDFHIAGQVVARDVDVNSDGKGRTVEINRHFASASTLTMVVKNDPIYLEYLEVEYGVPSNRFDLNRDYAKDSSIFLTLNQGGHLSKLRFSWSDNNKNAKTRVWINGQYLGEVDVNSNGQVKELAVNQRLNPGAQLVLQVVNDPARINWVEAVFQ